MTCPKHRAAPALVLVLALLAPACGTAAAGENAVAANNGPSRRRPAAPLKVRKVADSVVDPQALNFPSGPWGPAINGQIFQQDGVASHEGYQYATYYDGGRRLCVARRKLPAAGWEVIRFDDYRIGGHNDIHNVATLGICPGDGTIHLAFDHHCSPLHYRVSAKHAATRPAEAKWAPSLFGQVTSELTCGTKVSGVTYPRFFSTPRGRLQLYYRLGSSGDGDGHLSEYDPKSSTWQHLGIIISRSGSSGVSRSRCPYMNGMHYDANGRLHTTWGWCESPQVMSHDLQYAYSDDFGRTWFNSDSAGIGQPAKGMLINVESPGVTVWKIPQNEGLSNCSTQAVDSQGRIHVVLWQGTPGTPRENPYEDLNAWRYYHYWRDKNGKWHRIALPCSGRRPKLLMDRRDNAYLVFAKGPEADQRKKVTWARLHVAAATGASQWSDWTVVYTQKERFLGEPLVDFYRWRDEGVLSVYVQQHPEAVGRPSPLHVIDLKPDR